MLLDFLTVSMFRGCEVQLVDAEGLAGGLMGFL